MFLDWTIMDQTAVAALITGDDVLAKVAPHQTTVS